MNRSTASAFLIPIAIGLFFLLACFVLYGSAGHDDSHITYWASYSLSHFGEILNYNGDRIEQSSSLLLTLLVTLFSTIFHANVVTTGYLLTYICGALTIALTYFTAQKLFNLSSKHSIFCALLLSTSPAFMLWNSSGMESTLAALCLLAFIHIWAQILNSSNKTTFTMLVSAILITLCLISVRPEMISLTASLVFFVFIFKRRIQIRGSTAYLAFYLTVLACILLLLGWRYFYFHALMPLPVYAKVSGFSFDKILFGLLYLIRYGAANLVFVFGFIAASIYLIKAFTQNKNDGQINHLQTTQASLLGAFTIIAYSGFICISGGDWMQSGRFLVPILPLCTLLCTQWLSTQKTQWFFLSLLIIFISHLYGNFSALSYQSHGTPLWASYRISEEHQQRYSLFEQLNQEHLRDMGVIDHLDQLIGDLLPTSEHKPVLASGQSGMVYFYTAKKYLGKIQFYDNRGLIENSLLKCNDLKDIERGAQGLNLNHDGFFSRLDKLQADCSIQKPDILYDINDMSRQLPQRMEAYDYTLIHQEGGKMIETISSFPIHTLPAPNFIMVENNVFKHINNQELTTVKYKIKPLVARW